MYGKGDDIVIFIHHSSWGFFIVFRTVNILLNSSGVKPTCTCLFILCAAPKQRPHALALTPYRMRCFYGAFTLAENRFLRSEQLQANVCSSKKRERRRIGLVIKGYRGFALHGNDAKQLTSAVALVPSRVNRYIHVFDWCKRSIKSVVLRCLSAQALNLLRQHAWQFGQLSAMLIRRSLRNLAVCGSRNYFFIINQ